jgi:molybdopterin molybdotransferase
VARLAAAGFATVPVARRPTVAILATGDEIVPPGANPRDDQIFDALSLPLALRLRASGAVLGDLAMIGDDPQGFGRALERLLPVNIVVIVGGASGGRHDHARACLDRRGMDLVVPSILMKPGKPFWCGLTAGGTIVIGLPGNPVAALACVELFLLPLVRAWQGSRDPAPSANMPCAAQMAGGALEKVIFARRTGDGVVPLGGHDSAALSVLAGANVLLRPAAGMIIPLS